MVSASMFEPVSGESFIRAQPSVVFHFQSSNMSSWYPPAETSEPSQCHTMWSMRVPPAWEMFTNFSAKLMWVSGMPEELVVQFME